jgi:hypothetical protein
MNEMLSNQSFEDAPSVEETTSDVNTSEENTSTEPSISEEINNAEESNEVSEETNVEETTEKTNVDNSGQTTEETKLLSQPKRPKETRAQRRIKKILAEKKSLEEELAKKKNIEFQQNSAGEIELTPTQLNEFISTQVHETLAQQRERELAQERASLWDDDIQELVSTNPELDPDSPNFNPELSSALTELIQTTNIDDSGNPILRKLPSEVYQTIKSTLSAAKNDGKREATDKITETANNTAIQNTTSEASEKKYTDAELARMQKTNPQRYVELIEEGII